MRPNVFQMAFTVYGYDTQMFVLHDSSSYLYLY